MQREYIDKRLRDAAHIFQTQEGESTIKGLGGNWVATRITVEFASGTIELKLQPAEEITPWSGEGLPPVGTVCEVYFHKWRKCEIFAHRQVESGTDVLFTYVTDAGLPDWNWEPRQENFRPIRTAEELAVEAREKAIAEMQSVLPGWENTERLCGLVYDAGYRKTQNCDSTGFGD